MPCRPCHTASTQNPVPGEIRRSYAWPVINPYLRHSWGLEGAVDGSFLNAVPQKPRPSGPDAAAVARASGPGRRGSGLAGGLERDFHEGRRAAEGGDLDRDPG